MNNHPSVFGDYDLLRRRAWLGLVCGMLLLAWSCSDEDESTDDAVSNGMATSNGATSNGTASNGATSNTATSNGSTTGQTTASGLTYYQDAKPVIDTYCVPCHVEGGAAPFPLDTFDRVSPFASAMGAAIESGQMPPWMPADNCATYKYDRSIPADQKATLLTWLGEADRAEGDAATAVEVELPPNDLENPDIITGPMEPYTPNPAEPDDYRCFFMDVEFDVETFIHGSQVVPGAGALVHHALIYMVPPESVEIIERLDAADEGPGYTCFGGPGLTPPITISGWVPGARPNILPDDTGVQIPAGSRLLMQVHYNLTTTDPEPDLTELHLSTTTEPPAFVVTSRPLPEMGLLIEANDPESVQTRDYTNYSDKAWRIIGVNGHMHLLGQSIRVEAIHEGDDASCILDIPAWDFNWQQGYNLTDDAYIEVEPGEKVRVTCVYDNSMANQPVVNGEQLEPRDVSWGEGTYDEMCLSYVQLIEPYAPVVPKALCEDFQACYDTCDPDDDTCLFACAQTGGGNCAQCVFQGSLGCSVSQCAPTLVEIQTCIVICLLSDDIGACLEAECPDGLDAYMTCADPIFDAGICDEELTECGVTLGSGE